jgi:hypothetical protein
VRGFSIVAHIVNHNGSSKQSRNFPQMNLDYMLARALHYLEGDSVESIRGG